MLFGILINEAAIQKTLKGFPATIPNWAVAYSKAHWWHGCWWSGSCRDRVAKTANKLEKRRTHFVLLAAAICKILYRVSLFRFLLFYLFWPCICIALLLPSMLTQLHLWKRPAVCQFVCCFAAKENMSKISTRKKRVKNEKELFWSPTACSKISFAQNRHTHIYARTLTHQRTHTHSRTHIHPRTHKFR